MFHSSVNEIIEPAAGLREYFVPSLEVGFSETSAVPPEFANRNFFLIVEYALDGETGGAATEPQLLQRNESRDIHMPRGALNTKVPKTKIPAHSRRRRARRTGYLVS